MSSTSRVKPDIDVSDKRYPWSYELYETRSNFYLVGQHQDNTISRILTINRLEHSELNVYEDTTIYSKEQCDNLLRTLNDGNKKSGGLRFLANCYGIIGFVKFLGPYYMLLITERRQIGTICGHAIYAISESKIITVSNSTIQFDNTYSKKENRYMKLLSAVDLTKDFFFSYTYHVMHSLQENLSDCQKEQVVDETMFVWNEFLTRQIRNLLKSTMWTVALVYGFFKQEKLLVSGKQFKLSLIARRSRHQAGTRYLKRGVNKSGNVANEVDTEQIVCHDHDCCHDDCSGGCPAQVTSIVQNRGSIPLYWSQKASMLNPKPDIVLEKEKNYETTKLHFANLAKRYGSPIIVLNLIKTCECRESKLRLELANAIDFINKDSSTENGLGFLHWDLNKNPRRKAGDMLEFLGKVAESTLNLTGIFYQQIAPTPKNDNNDVNSRLYEKKLKKAVEDNKPHIFQSGVLRTNCIDCLDRTNIAQYAYGLSALGLQLCTLDLIDDPNIDSKSDLANDLMTFYESMGDALAVQYTGSASHNKIFSERRGSWKTFIQLQEFARTIQRYFSNSYMDVQKQDAIDVFLGRLRPQNDAGVSLPDDKILHQNNTLAPNNIQMSSIASTSSSRNFLALANKHNFKDDDRFYSSGCDVSNFFDLQQFSSASHSYKKTQSAPTTMKRHSSEHLTNVAAQNNPSMYNHSKTNVSNNQSRSNIQVSSFEHYIKSCQTECRDYSQMEKGEVTKQLA